MLETWYVPPRTGYWDSLQRLRLRTGGASSMGEHIYRIFWLDEDEPAWYYEHEVESVDEAR